MNKMRDFMSEYYDEMKKDMGIDDNYGEDEDQPQLDEVMLRLKPNMNPANFIKFMNKKDNIQKNVRNKAIARKMHKKKEDDQFKETNLASHFHSAYAIRNHKRMQPESKDVDQILSVLEIVNKEAIKSGIGGGLHGPANRMLNGINMLRSKQSKGPLNFMEDPSKRSSAGTATTKAMTSHAGGVRGLSNYKADLVRHNIVTRTDLMKLY